MASETFYTAIDLGTTKVCTIIAKIGPEGELKVLGTGIVPSQGMNKGSVESISETKEAVKASLEEAQRYLGRSVSWAYLGVTGDHITSLNTTGFLKGSGENEAISSEDLQHLIHSSYPQVSNGKEVLHVIPTGYLVDGLTGVRNPVGLHADRVQVESHVVMGEAAVLKNLVKTVEGCGVPVRSVVLQPLAAAEAILTQDERELGTVLVDIGGGTTDVMIFRGGSPWFTSIIPVGGNQLTRDLSVALGVPNYMAEEIKVRWGHAISEAVPGDEEVRIPGFQGQPQRTVSQRSLCIPIHDRLIETLKLILLQVQKAGLRNLPHGGMVITGGTAEMPGLQELAQKATGAPVRIGYPEDIRGLPSQLRKPAFSTSVGALLWGIKHHGEKRAYRNGDQTLLGYRSLFKQIKKKVTRSSV